MAAVVYTQVYTGRLSPLTPSAAPPRPPPWPPSPPRAAAFFSRNAALATLRLLLSWQLTCLRVNCPGRSSSLIFRASSLPWLIFVRTAFVHPLAELDLHRCAGVVRNRVRLRSLRDVQNAELIFTLLHKLFKGFTR